MTSRLYGDVANARDLGIEPSTVRGALLADAETVRHLGGGERVARMVDYMLAASTE